MADPQPPYPLFPPLSLLNDQARSALPINLEVLQRLEATPEHLNALATWRTGVDFLVRESAKPGFEERHYKKLCPILESMMHWSWTIRDKPLHDWNSADAKSFMTFIMRPPITWVTTPGCSRYSKKTKQNFANKSIDPTWRPIIRPTLTGNDPGLSSKHHRNWYMTHGREYFDFLARPANSAAPAATTAAYTADTNTAATCQQQDKSKNPFQDMAPKDYEFRVEKPQAVFSPTQLSDFLDIAESLASYNEKWEPLLFLTALAVFSEIPMRAVAATQTIKPTFSYFKPQAPDSLDAIQARPKTDFAKNYSKSHRVSPKGPGVFESPLYLRRSFALDSRFEGYFQRYAHFRHIKEPAVSSQSFLFPQENGLDAYGYGSLIEIFSEFCASILSTLRSRPKATLANWKGSDKLDPEASLTFNELRASAKRACMIPESTASGIADEDPSVWPDIGIRQALSRRIVFNFAD